LNIFLYFRKINSFVVELYSDNDKIGFRSEIKYLMYLVLFFDVIPYSLSTSVAHVALPVAASSHRPAAVALVRAGR
jgi:hypothetical protein